MTDFLGPIMLDLLGTKISDYEKKLLLNPLVGGVILFSRNFKSKDQIKKLCYEIKSLRNPKLLIAVDHEGGRVQRFKEGFSIIPPMAEIGKIYQSDRKLALKISKNLAWLMAYELLEVGVDFSFAPVLDIDVGISKVIGDRAFHDTPLGVVELTQYFIDGMHLAGMKSVGKHFPGHGSVEVDSHFELPIDNRSFQEIENQDLIPFSKVKNLDAIMPAHIIYSKCDDKPAGFSKFWLQDILRKQLNFSGIIFSDDLSMEGACQIGDYPIRVKTALNAGCDMVLICNNQQEAKNTLKDLNHDLISKNNKLNQMQGIITKNDLMSQAKDFLNCF